MLRVLVCLLALALLATTARADERQRQGRTLNAAAIALMVIGSCALTTASMVAIGYWATSDLGDDHLPQASAAGIAVGVSAGVTFFGAALAIKAREYTVPPPRADDKARAVAPPVLFEARF